MALNAFLLNGLLGDYIACGKKDGGRHGLCEYGPLRQLAVVPATCCVSLFFLAVFSIFSLL